MRYQAFLPFVSIVCFCILVSCSVNPEKENKFKDILQIDNVNKDIKLDYWLPEDKNNLRIGDSITLMIKNDSQSEITFQSNSWVEIFTFVDNDWKKINNLGVYSPSKFPLLPKGKDSPGVTSVDFAPEIKATNSAVTIRAVVIGTESNPNLPGGIKVGAYMDIPLKP